jgi:hypothetical protein
MNGLSEERFTVVPVAAGAEDGRLAVDEMSYGTLEASPNGAKFVAMRSFDSVCWELRFCPTHIKIDVEGYELAVLRGAVGILEHFKPIIQLEIHNTVLLTRGTHPEELCQFMKAHGYEQVWSLVQRTSHGTAHLTRTLWCRSREGD